MDIMQLIIYGMIIVIMGTVVLAVLSYLAFKLRDRGKRGPAAPVDTGPLFFERVQFARDPARAPVRTGGDRS
jgi:hypothetical protein